ITSRLLTSSSAGPQYSEALLILDEPAPGFQYACVGAGNTTVCPGYGNGLGTANAPSLVGYYGSAGPGTRVAGCTQGVTLTTCPVSACRQSVADSRVYSKGPAALAKLLAGFLAVRIAESNPRPRPESVWRIAVQCRLHGRFRYSLQEKERRHQRGHSGRSGRS